ncbi:cyclin-dependent kinase inhibitor 1 isoform X1 [Pangasianodon hypophthalmus]|uniref:cyclin-dependent kinase inhibitor 1 isoform X1 n=2 Tax=Pangasianodon hypophthalmus TaxID=310915 RepID=UPI00230725E4|nr:cyclin-dependent kinase inhibitor 1 isoform X1 [Pangasianodon hypophthalmus]XP_053083101.1 cyclin-dependent kinase inhibitor 1 isoform X1 [Pangasianodon hypophthalmus]
MCVMMSLPVRGRVLRAVCSGGVGGVEGGVGGVGGGVGGAARRCLFGAVDHEELQRDYMLLMRAELEGASRRWSFDFITNKPRMGGDFEWVGLPEARVPFLYRDCTVGAEPRPKGAGPASDLEKEDIPKTPERCDRNTHSAEKHTLKRKQTNITDFYQAKRRVVTTRKSGQ